MPAADSRQVDGGPGSRAIQNIHSNRDRSMTYLQGECSYRRAEEEEIQRRWSACSQ